MEVSAGISTRRGRHNAKPVTIDGVRYPSICAAARAFGIDHNLVISRLRQGWQLRRALTRPKVSGHRSAQPVTVYGTKYRSVQAACAALRVRYSAVSQRLRNGWDIEAAVEAVKTPRTAGGEVKVLIIIEGQCHESLEAAARARGLDPSVVRGQIASGWTLKEALSVAAGHPSRAVDVTFRGQRFESIEAAAAAFGVSAANVLALRGRGLSAAQAIEELLMRERERDERLTRRERFKDRVRREGYVGPDGVEFRGVKYSTLAALADAFAIRPVTLRNRLRLGWTLEQGVGLAEPPKLVRNIKEVTVGGQVFANMSEAARHFGVSWSVARYRLQVGASPEQAFGLEPFEARRGWGKPLVVAGERFGSLNEACLRFKKSPGLITRRLQRGETPEQAFELEQPSQENAAVVIAGHRFRFLAEAARHYKVPYAKLRYLIEKKGIEPIKAVRMARGTAG